MQTRRQFLIAVPAGLVVAAVGCGPGEKQAAQKPANGAAPAPGAPPTFGTGAGGGLTSPPPRLPRRKSWRR